MEKIKFGDKVIIIRSLGVGDLSRAKDYQKYINSLVAENAKILINQKMSEKDELEFIKSTLQGIRKREKVCMVAEYNGEVVGVSDVKLDRYRRNHIGVLGISIKNGYRGVGLGETLIRTVIASALKQLKPKLKVLMLTVYEDNKPALSLYKKVGFKKVAYIKNAVQEGKSGKLVGEYIMTIDV